MGYGHAELAGDVRPQDAVLLYDGLCGFCDGTVRWLLRRTHANDDKGHIYFAAQQSELAQAHPFTGTVSLQLGTRSTC